MAASTNVVEFILVTSTPVSSQAPVNVLFIGQLKSADRSSWASTTIQTVVASRKVIEDKLKRNSNARDEALEDRERLLKEMNQLYEQFNEQEQEVKQSQKQYRSQLDNQVAENNCEKVRKAQEEAEEDRKWSQVESEAEQKLAAEMERLQLNYNEYRPKVRNKTGLQFSPFTAR
ncbi:hypothetical protein J6590_055160 [Homalodisca vitripennis]|nr:hypothetical protein J6590_055160 [Homalodisca vitripennis]